MRLVYKHKKRAKKDLDFIVRLCYREIKKSEETRKIILKVDINTGKILIDELTQRYVEFL
jgi:transcriptional regulator of met regulon